MARKSKAFNYFAAFIKMSENGRKEALALRELLTTNENTQDYLKKIKELEASSDEIAEQVLREVNNSFITPIDREDILALTELLDNICDSIEDIVDMLDMYAVEHVTEEAQQFSVLIKRAAVALYEVMEAFEHYKQFENVHQAIRSVREIEGEGDTLYHSAMKKIFADDALSTKDLIIWKDIYSKMERTLNDCENVAKLAGTFAIKNT